MLLDGGAGEVEAFAEIYSDANCLNVVLGRNVNGWNVWKDHTGSTIDEIYKQK